MERKIILNGEQVADILRGNSVTLTQDQRDEVVESVAKTMRKAKRWIRRYMDDTTLETNGKITLGISPSAKDKDGEEQGEKVAYQFDKETGELRVYAPEFFGKFAEDLGLEVAKSMAIREYGAEFEFKASTVTVHTLSPVVKEEAE